MFSEKKKVLYDCRSGLHGLHPQRVHLILDPSQKATHMSAADRTLLASLGFADPDKKDQMHDLACEYLSQGVRPQRIVEFVEPEGKLVGSQVEFQISKGEGQYRTTIGFVDVLLEWAGPQRKGRIIVEVKIARVGIGDIVRQLNVYREYLSYESAKEAFARKLGSNTIAIVAPKRVLATAFELDAGQVDLLKREEIQVIHLGDAFIKWFEERSSQNKPEVPQF